jgi:hypothetical protein
MSRLLAAAPIVSVMSLASATVSSVPLPVAMIALVPPLTVSAPSVRSPATVAFSEPCCCVTGPITLVPSSAKVTDPAVLARLVTVVAAPVLSVSAPPVG